jgi:type I restriction enzyme, S subunit
MTAETAKTALPALRFPQFADDPEWKFTRGGELFSSISKRMPASDLPVLAITQEHGAIPRDDIDYHVSVSSEGVAAYKEVQAGDFIISLRSFQGGIEYSRYRGLCSPAYIVLRRKVPGSDDFYRHLFKSRRLILQLTRNIEGLRDGKMISYAQFAEQLLPVPEPDEQQKVADCLNSLDEVVAAEDKKLKALRRQRQGMLQQLFPRVGTTAPDLRFPQFHNSGAWREARLDESLAKRGTGHTPTKARADYYNGGIKWVSLADSRYLDNGLISDTSVEISEAGVANSSAVVHPAGSVILSRDAGVGKSAIISHPMAVSQHFIVWTCTSRLYNWFLYYQLQRLKPVFERVATGNTIKTIGLPFFDALKISVPPTLEEQATVVDCLRSLDELIAAQRSKVDAFKTHKQGLLQRLFPSRESEES